MSAEKQRLRTDIDWQKWRDRLDNFEHWRERQARRKEAGEKEYEMQSERAWSIAHDFFAWCAPLGHQVLDVACGGGWNKRLLAERSYIGVDPLIVDDRERFPIVQGVGEGLPLKAGCFDAVVITAALDHLASLQATFEECWRVLKTNGALCLLTSARDAVEDGDTLEISEETEPTPLTRRIVRRVREDGITGLAKSLYYRVYYASAIQDLLNNTHVREIYISELQEILIGIGYDVSLTRSEKNPEIIFVKAVKKTKNDP